MFVLDVNREISPSTIELIQNHHRSVKMFLKRIPSSSILLNSRPTAVNEQRCMGYFSKLKRKQDAREFKPKRVAFIKSEELYPFDYSQIASDFDDEVYRDLLEQKDAFDVHKLVDVRELFDNRCHFGHKTGSLSDFMKPYLFGQRQDITIFDLNQTVENFKLALNFVAHMAFRGSIILFVNGDPNTAHIVEKAAFECGEYSQCRDFDLRSLVDSEAYFGMPIRSPDMVIMFRTKTNNFDQHNMVRIAAKLMMPTVGIVDSDCDPRLITYPIPANDDTPCAIKLYARLFAEAIMRGKEKRRQLLKKGAFERQEKKAKSILSSPQLDLPKSNDNGLDDNGPDDNGLDNGLEDVTEEDKNLGDLDLNEFKPN